MPNEQVSSHFTQWVRGEKKLVRKNKIHLGSWNIRSLTDKLRELVDTVIRKHVNILCIQKTKWIRQMAKEVDNIGFKLRYTKKERNINDVGILIDKT
jgi:exonuclease III